MTIDLAWKSLSQSEQLSLLQHVRMSYIDVHTETCERCQKTIISGVPTVTQYCGWIQHMVDLADAMEDSLS